MSREAPAPFLRSYRGTRPRFASGTLMSLQEGTGTPNPPHQMTQREAVFALVPTGNPPSLRFGHPDVTTDDTVFPRWDTSRVPHISSAPTQGHPSPGRSAPPRSASESVRADTLRALGGKRGYTRYYRTGRYRHLRAQSVDSTKGRCYPRSYRGTRPRFASGTLMSLTDNTAPFVCA